jgi:hypothetical protein
MKTNRWNPRVLQVHSLLNVDVLSEVMVPISIQYWYKPKAAKGEPEEPEPEEGAAVNYVTKIMKDGLWESLIPHFTLPATESLELAEAQKEKVRE